MAWMAVASKCLCDERPIERLNGIYQYLKNYEKIYNDKTYLAGCKKICLLVESDLITNIKQTTFCFYILLEGFIDKYG